MRSELKNPSDALPENTADLEALQAILHAHSDRLLAYLTRQMSNNLRRFVEPQDVLQDTFFEAFRRSHEFQMQGPDSVFRWLVTIARHRMLAIVRMQRSLKRGGRVAEKDGFASVVGFLEELAVYQRTPSQSAMSHELVSAIQQAINALEPQYCRAIQLRYIEGLTVQDAADRMGRTCGSILMLCNRGLAALKVQLQAASLPI
jgi:RNA polymerase sigma-70 factor (ECF subfamily)